VTKLALLTLILVLVPSAALAQDRPPMKSCGDLELSSGLLVGDLTARRVSCPNARRVARRVPARCGDNGSCTVRGFSCLTAQAADELRFARCIKPRGNDELFRTIRFDFGS
jgi:hypothetical protein